MKSRKEQLEIELAFENGAKIEWKPKLMPNWELSENPVFKWEVNDYRIKEEPKRIHFDGSDAFNLALQKFKHINDSEKYPSIEVSIRAHETGVVFANGEFTYEELAKYWGKWNDLTKEWQPCNKVA